MGGFIGRALAAVILLASAHAFSPLLQHALPARAGCLAASLARPSAGSGAEPDRLWEWARRRGIELPSAEIGEKDGMRGVIAAAPLRPGDAIVRLPRNCALCVGNNQMCPFPSHISPSFWEQSSMSVRLALLLLFEKAQGGRSHLAEWLAALPECHQDKPATWSEAEVAELQDDTLSALVVGHSHTIDRIYEHLRAHPEHGHISRGAWLWAMHTVASRSFLGHVAAAPEALLDRVVVALLMRLRAALPGLAFAVPPGLRRWVDGTRSSSELLLLEPMVDMLNHCTSARAETTLDPSTDVLTVRTHETWNAGDEVRIDYAGAKSNAKLLLSYGFVEEKNPCNTAYLTESQLLRAAQSVSSEDFGRSNAHGDGNSDQEAVDLLEAYSLIDGLDQAGPCEVSAQAMSEQCATVLSVLLCTHEERLRLKEQGVLNSKEVGMMCDETERRVALAAVYACEGAVAACPTSLEQDRAMLRDLAHRQDKGTDALRLETAVRYRAARKEVLIQAAETYRNRLQTAPSPSKEFQRAG